MHKLKGLPLSLWGYKPKFSVAVSTDSNIDFASFLSMTTTWLPMVYAVDVVEEHCWYG